jgi:hypothetical protein
MNSSPEKPALKVDWCSHAAAKYACEKWHYSRTLPVGKIVKVGVWENGAFVGCVLFSRGANKDLGSPYGLTMTECCELVRVAMSSHWHPVTKCVALAIRWLKKTSPGVRLVVSFADPTEGHLGIIYQAGNWVYTGRCDGSFEYVFNGKRLNKRAYTGCQFGSGARSKLPTGAKKVSIQGKHRYLMPLDPQMRAQIIPLAKPYPKRQEITPQSAGSISDDAPGDQLGQGGSTPTPALQSSDTSNHAQGGTDGTP